MYIHVRRLAQRDSSIASRSDTDLAIFLRNGHLFLKKGGTEFSGVSNTELTSVALYMRTLKAVEQPAPGNTGDTDSGDSELGEELPRWVGPIAAAGPAGLAQPVLEVEPREALHHIQDPHLPENAHVFFGIHFCMTRVHGIHVLIGMLVVVWLLLGAAKGKFSDRYYTPVYLFSQFWHFVTIVWILMFPLLYLMN